VKANATIRRGWQALLREDAGGAVHHPALRVVVVAGDDEGEALVGAVLDHYQAKFDDGRT
jgi:hypothetical protein